MWDVRIVGTYESDHDDWLKIIRVEVFFLLSKDVIEGVK